MAEARPTGPTPEFSASYNRYALGLLVVVYAFAFIDRQIVNILLEPIRQEFGLADWQLGLLSGAAFGVVYSTLGVPIAQLADRRTRRSIIAISLAFWSVMTALQGFARGFTTLLVARLLVGVGEAGCSPPAHSIISDLFAPASRARALAIYAFGIPIGGALGTFLGGEIREEFGWRWAFAVVGAPGVLLAGVVALTLREPTRGHWDPASTRQEHASLRETLVYLFARPAFLHMAFAGALHAFYGYGAATFNIPFFERIHGFGPRELGRAFAAIGITAGVAGTFLGGYLTDRYLGRDPRAYAFVPGVGSLAAIPFVLGMYTAPDGWMALGIALVPAVFAGLYLGPTFALTQNLVPARMRTRAAAVLLLILNVVGMVFGPVFVGALSDVLKPSFGVESVRFALLATVTGGAAWSVAHYALASRTLSRDLGLARS